MLVFCFADAPGDKSDIIQCRRSGLRTCGNTLRFIVEETFQIRSFHFTNNITKKLQLLHLKKYHFIVNRSYFLDLFISTVENNVFHPTIYDTSKCTAFLVV